jgi:hypothetical protein
MEAQGNPQQTVSEIQQLFDQRITSIIGNQAIHIARLESQIVILQKEVGRLASLIPAITYGAVDARQFLGPEVQSEDGINQFKLREV